LAIARTLLGECCKLPQQPAEGAYSTPQTPWLVLEKGKGSWGRVKGRAAKGKEGNRREGRER